MKNGGTEDSRVSVPLPGQKKGLDLRLASERPSNSAPQTPDCLFLAPVGAVKQGQGQFTYNSTTLWTSASNVDSIKSHIQTDRLIYVIITLLILYI